MTISKASNVRGIFSILLALSDLLWLKLGSRGHVLWGTLNTSDYAPRETSIHSLFLGYYYGVSWIPWIQIPWARNLALVKTSTPTDPHAKLHNQLTFLWDAFILRGLSPRFLDHLGTYRSTRVKYRGISYRAHSRSEVSRCMLFPAWSISKVLNSLLLRSWR